MNPALIDTAAEALRRHFGPGEALFVQSPGRVNLIGEHTDYNDGFVLPCAIDRGTVVAVRRRADRRVRVVACDHGEATDEFSVAGAIEPRGGAVWPNYVRGVFQQWQESGAPLAGLDMAITGNLPQGGGLSSSASLQVGVARAIAAAQTQPGWTATGLALLAQKAENRFVGCQCGIMDPLACAAGRADHALLIDCRNLAVEPVPLPPGTALLIVDSRVQRGLVDSHYNERRRQCQEAALLLGVPSLRQATLAQLHARAAAMPREVRMRARHVITENERTLGAARALRRDDLRTLGRLMAESHRSLREDFEVTVPAVDRLVELLAPAIGEEGGARMTGGGFGGCVVALMRRERAGAAMEAVRRGYLSPSREPARLMLCEATDGARVVGG